MVLLHSDALLLKIMALFPAVDYKMQISKEAQSRALEAVVEQVSHIYSTNCLMIEIS